jgi:dTDP-4-amino-4,6-dideoxygalactose transaminase
MADDPYIVFGSPSIGEEEIEAVTQTLRSCWIGTGPKVHAFEDAMRRHTGAEHAMAVGSCTAALHLAMVVSGVGPGDEVITTPMTFAATANAVVHTGATPVFVDCRRDTMNIDPEAIEAAITPRTKAILPVHFAGRPADMHRIGEIAREHELLVIEDAAHALEAVYEGRRVGSIGDLSCFSFYVTKNITTGEGGMVTTNRRDLAEKIRTYALHGLSADAWSRFSDRGYKHYEVVFPGFKYNMTDMQASLGIVQLEKVSRWLERRNAIWARYDEAFRDLPVSTPAPAAPRTVHARHLYTLLVDDGARIGRDALIVALHRRGIGTGVHYRALHTHPYYRERFGHRAEQFPNAAYIGERTISLPMSPKLGDDDVDRIIEAVRDELVPR